MTIKRQHLILLILVAGVTSTFAQNKKITLKGTGKNTFITYEEYNAIIQFDKRSFIEAFNMLPKATADQQRFDKIMGKASKTGKLNINANKSDVTQDEYLERRFIVEQVGAPLLKAGKATVINKNTGKPVSTIEYQDLEGDVTYYLFEGTSFPFFISAPPQEDFIAPAPGEDEEPVLESVAIPDEPEPDENYIYDHPDMGAEYPGGISKLISNLYDNLKKLPDCSGITSVSFVVNTDGTTTDYTFEKHASDSTCDAEAMRVIKATATGTWIPARVKDKPVRSRYSLPINYDIY